MSHGTSLDELFNSRDFIGRHIGPNTDQTRAMLDAMGLDSIDQLIDLTVPASIRGEETRALAAPVNEQQALAELKTIAGDNQRFKSYIGMGYHPTYVPPVILRNVLENAGWYTAYTPYQPEIAQGRLEGLLNFQQMIIELTGMDMANASMLDEATAAAEAMAMAKRVARKNKSNTFFADKHCHPQTLAVLQTRASHFGFELVIGDITQDLNKQEVFGAITQYPGTSGEVKDLRPIVNQAHEQDALLIVAADILSTGVTRVPRCDGGRHSSGQQPTLWYSYGLWWPTRCVFWL